MPANVLLRKALGQLKQERDRLDKQITALEAVVGSSGGRAARRLKRSGSGKRRSVSAAQRRAISKRMKIYWAKKRAAKK